MVFLHIVEKVNINLHNSKLWFAWKKHPNNEISVQKIVTYYAKKICEKSKTSSYICRYILFVCSIIFYFRKQKVTQFLKQEHEQWAQIRYRFFFVKTIHHQIFKMNIQSTILLSKKGLLFIHNSLFLHHKYTLYI